ncbi:MAG TPA: aminopeptidase [Flavobacteriales bacterium]|nr:aminopeptidase [Flavobacteriales bacterium]
MKFQKRFLSIGNLTFLVLVFFSTSNAFAQDSESAAFSYTFKPLVDNTATSVKNQCRTGTCWSYSMSSFLESEAARISGHVVDLSEMATVRYTYPLKAQMYLRMQGKYQFGAGSLSHDVLNAAAGWGLAPQEAFTGLQDGETVHNHGDMDAALLATVEALVKKPSGNLDPRWNETINGILDTYLGELPTSFEFEGKSYTPASFRDYLGIDPEAYINITSFTHHPFGKSFVLEVPDNFSRGEFYNVPIEDLQRAVEAAVVAGYTVAWDADVSEKGFSFRNGMALLLKVKSLISGKRRLLKLRSLRSLVRRHLITKPQPTITSCTLSDWQQTSQERSTSLLRTVGDKGMNMGDVNIFLWHTSKQKLLPY